MKRHFCDKCDSFIPDNELHLIEIDIYTHSYCDRKKYIKIELCKNCYKEFDKELINLQEKFNGTVLTDKANTNE